MVAKFERVTTNKLPQSYDSFQLLCKLGFNPCLEMPELFTV